MHTYSKSKKDFKTAFYVTLIRIKPIQSFSTKKNKATLLVLGSRFFVSSGF